MPPKLPPKQSWEAIAKIVRNGVMTPENEVKLYEAVAQARSQPEVRRMFGIGSMTQTPEALQATRGRKFADDVDILKDVNSKIPTDPFADYIPGVHATPYDSALGDTSMIAPETLSIRGTDWPGRMADYARNVRKYPVPNWSRVLGTVPIAPVSATPLYNAFFGERQ